MVLADDMVVFAAVVSEGSFTRAAAKLGVTKQTVSERVARLEDKLAARLLERTTRRLRPTDRGARFFEHCAQVTGAVDAALCELRSASDTPTGTLRISTPVLFGRRFLGRLINELMLEHERLRVEAVLTDRYVDLVAEGFDLAIRVGTPVESTMIATKLGESDVHVVASPALLDRVHLPGEDLSAARCIGLRSTETWTVGARRHKVTPTLVVNDLELTLDAALAGVGIARLPAFMIRGHVAAERLVVLFGDEPTTRRSVFAVYPSRRYLSLAARVFIDRLKIHFEPLGPLVSAPPRRRRRR